MNIFVRFLLIFCLVHQSLLIAQTVPSAHAPKATPVKNSPPAILPQPGAPGAPSPTGAGLQPPVFPNYQTGIRPPTLVGQPLTGQPIGFRTPVMPPPPQYPFPFQPPPPGYQYCNPGSGGGYPPPMPMYGGYGAPVALCQQRHNNMLPLLAMPLMLGLASGGFGGGSGPRASAVNGYGPGVYSGVAGSGVLEECGSLPPQVTEALNQSLEFRKSCRRFADKGPTRKVVINDYSDMSKPPYMWIFDSKGTCLKKTAVTFGNGQIGYNARPLPCAQNNTHMTPPGFHLTAYHGCGKNDRGQWTCNYPPEFSLLMVGIQGQGSAGRPILIHAAEAPGTASSWGCAGVGPILQVKQLLGYGSLVYNYFGNTRTAGCRKNAGTNLLQCQEPDGGIRIPDDGVTDPDAVALFIPY